MRVILIVILGLNLGGCSYPQGLQMTSTDTFTYWHLGYGGGQELGKDDPKAEKARLTELERNLTQNGKCPQGYRITRRDEILTYKNPFSAVGGADKYKIYYTGECTGPAPEGGSTSQQ